MKGKVGPFRATGFEKPTKEAAIERYLGETTSPSTHILRTKGASFPQGDRLRSLKRRLTQDPDINFLPFKTGVWQGILAQHLNRC